MNVERNKLILWSPHLSEHFIVVSSTIRLYEKRSAGAVYGVPPPLPSLPSSSASIDGAAASSPYRLLDSVTYPQQSIRAVAWSTSPSHPLLVCAGLLSGKVAVIRLQADVKVVKELDPHYQRQCHAVAFNPTQPHLLAVGLERQRNSPGVLVWDIEKGSAVASHRSSPAPSTAAPSPAPTHAAVLVPVPSPAPSLRAPLQLLRVSAPSPVPPSLTTASSTSSSSSAVSAASSSSSMLSISSYKRSAVALESVTEAAFRLSTSEAATSLAWHPSTASLLAVGTGSKWLRLYDTRDGVRGERGAAASVVAHSRAVMGLRYDPHLHHRVASWSEDGLVKVWDHRQLTSPVLVVHSSGWKAAKARVVVEVDFCPTSTHLLSTISREEEFVRLWDLSGSLPHSEADVRAIVSQPEQSDCPPVKKVRTTGGRGWLSSLSWHPRDRQRLLVVSREGMVEEMRLHDDFIAVWGPRSELCSALDDRVDVMEGGEVQRMDIGWVMRERARAGYALDVERNRAIARQRREEEVERVWDWMAQTAGGGREAGGGATAVGVAAVAEGDSAAASTALTGLPLDGVMAALLPPDELSRFQLELHSAAASALTAHNHHSPQTAATLTSAPITSHAASISPALPSLLSPSSFSSSTPASPSPSSASSPLSSPLSSSASVYDSVMIQPASTMPPSKVYLSSGRLAALHRCGWFDLFTPPSSTAVLRKGGRPSVAAVNLETRLQGLECRGEYEYAAMLSVFHLDLPRALQSLKLGAADGRRHEGRRDKGGGKDGGGQRGGGGGGGGGEDLGLVALALAGYQAAPSGGGGRAPTSGAGGGGASDSSSSLWARTFSSTLAHQPMSTPLKAIFSFLSVPHPSLQSRHTFSALLSSDSPHAVSSTPSSSSAVGPLLSFPDRVAFACRFLPNQDLFTFIREAALHAIERGQLEGLLLTGLGQGSGGERLLQKHLDITGDVQTVALLSCYGGRERGGAVGGGEAAASRSERWLSFYRALLNQWQMWTERARLDVARALLHAQPHSSHSHPLHHTHTHHAALHTNPNHRPTTHQHPAQPSGSTSASFHSASASPSSALGLLPHVTARCSWCGSSLAVSSASSSTSSSASVSRSQRGPPSSFVRGCPHCRKSLPRCALCLLALDAATTPSVGPLRGSWTRTAGGGGGGAGSGGVASTNASANHQHHHHHQHAAASSRGDGGDGGRGERGGRGALGEGGSSDGVVGGGTAMDAGDAGGGVGAGGSAAAAAAAGGRGIVGWFSWCQHCRHGGHADHLREWFAQHQRCPVYDCTCTCATTQLSSAQLQ